MAQQTQRVRTQLPSSLEEGVDQIRTVVHRVDREFRKIQRQVSSRRKQIEKELVTRRRALGKRAQKEITRVQKQIARRPLVKQAQQRAGSLRAEAQSRLESGVATFFDALPIATRSEIDRIDRKLRAIDRKLRELEKTQGAASRAA
jgi:hypothetical protein